jgi:hypothetical protein
MNNRAMIPRITASIVRPDDLSADPLVELTIPPWCRHAMKLC